MGVPVGQTRREAERIAQLLELRPTAKLLDVGVGSGWPGLYLAQLTGCDGVVVDLPLAALRIALERATADRLSQRCAVVDTPDDYAVLLDQSVWCRQERTDLTAEFLQSMRTELEGMQARARALTDVIGSDEFTGRMKRRQATIAAVAAGFLRRELFVARAGR